MFAKRSVIGLYTDEEAAASALDALREAGYDQGEYEVLTGTPYPEGTFGEEEPKHTLYRWPLIGATCGFIVGHFVVICWVAFGVSFLDSFLINFQSTGTLKKC